jgi:transcriptional regulator with XRE-family HTH domain
MDWEVNIMSRIGALIKKARTERAMSPKELAKKCGVSESLILDVESGRKIVNDILTKQITKALKIEVDALDYEPSQPKEEAERTVVKQQAIPKEEKPKGQIVDRWEDAFSAVIKKIPVYGKDGKTVIDYKAIPSADKKIEGYNSDKIFYVRVEDNSITGFRLKQGDLVMTASASQVTKEGLYYIEYQGRHIIRQIKRMEGQRLILISHQGSIETVTIHERDIKVIGLCLKAEIIL